MTCANGGEWGPDGCGPCAACLARAEELIMLTNAHPKGRSRYEERKERKAEAAKTEAEVYAAVDERDGAWCRVCRHYLPFGAITLLTRGHHHHLVYRSKGGETSTANLVRICAACHNDEHAGRLQLSGNADERNELGKLAGIKVERMTESGFEVECFC